MSKTLYVPDHVAEKSRTSNATAASAYINKEEKVLDLYWIFPLMNVCPSLQDGAFSSCPIWAKQLRMGVSISQTL